MNLKHLKKDFLALIVIAVTQQHSLATSVAIFQLIRELMMK